MAELQQVNGTHYRATLRQWILCFVVCDFNVDVGPEIETIYPADVPFSQTDISTICFNSFPERHDAEVRDDAYFSFTLKNTSPDINLASPTPPYGSADLFYGTSIFRQEYDDTSKRSFNQKSLVLISNQEFPAFFINLLRVVVTGSAIGDITRLEAACAQMEGWPPPRIGEQELPFLGGIFSLEIPLFPSFPLQGLSSIFAAQQSLLHSISAYEPFQHWHSLLPFLNTPSLLYILYERALLGLPIIVLGQNPEHVSAIGHAIIDLIRPLPYAGIRRPYLPLQSISLGGESVLLDPSKHTSQTAFIIGITNPFLLQKLATNNSGKESTSSPSTNPFILALNATHTISSSSSPQSTISSTSLPADQTNHKQSKTSRLLSLAKSASHKHKNPNSSSTTAAKRIDIPGTPLTTQASPAHYLKKDKTFLASLAASEAAQNPTNATTHLIRRHFADLTAKLLAPINRFQLARKHESISPELGISEAHSFPVDQFIRSLGDADSNALFVGQTSSGRQRSREDFYGRFCRSVNFKVWIEVMLLAERQGASGMFDAEAADPI